MAKKAKAKNGNQAVTKIVVFGVDEDHWKPQAAWFPEKFEDQVRTAARQLGLNIIKIEAGSMPEIVSKLPIGRIQANGKGFVPYIRPDYYETLVAALNGRGQADPDIAALEPKSLLPEDWKTIDVGQLVLAHESLVEGWCEAIVVEKNGDRLTLQWRDFPKHARFTRHAASGAHVRIETDDLDNWKASRHARAAKGASSRS